MDSSVTLILNWERANHRVHRLGPKADLHAVLSLTCLYEYREVGSKKTYGYEKELGRASGSDLARPGKRGNKIPTEDWLANAASFQMLLLACNIDHIEDNSLDKNIGVAMIH